MQKMKHIGWFGLTYLYSIFIVAALPTLLFDFLFYRSDIFSLSVIVLTAALIFLPVTGSIAYAISRLPDNARNITRRWAAFIAAVGIVDIFLGLITLYLVSVLNWNWLNHFFKNPVNAYAVCILPAAIIIYIQSDKISLIERVKHIACLALVSAPIIIVYSIQTSPDFTNARAAGAKNERHLVYIVLDAWPSQYLHAYNPEALAGPIDQVASAARTYLGAHTSAAWTSAYFGTLYNGDKLVVNGEKRRHRTTKSLGAHLQAQNVGVRFMNFHRNGIPDSSSAHRSDHTGLRSYLLTEKFYWIPKALGLDYHLTLAGNGIAQNFPGSVRRAIFDWLNQTPKAKHKKKSNVLLDVLMPELRRMRQQHDKSITLFHTEWSKLGSGGSVDLSQIPKAQVIITPPVNATAKIRANDYRYEADYEPVANNVRRNTMRSILQQSTHIVDFIEALSTDPALADTVVILTADHGSMYAKGRYWYGYHPNREVIRIPFIVFDKGPKGTDAQLFGTPQITAAILEFFAGSLSSSGFVLKGTMEGPVFSLTLSANIKKEWYLVATYPNKAYWINLHPEGPGISLEMKTDGYQQTQIGKFDGAPPELAKKMKDILHSFGIAPEDIHSAFR